MAFFHGRLATFTLNSVPLSAFMNSIDYDTDADSHDTTTYGKSWRTFIGGLKSGTFSIGGLADNAVAGPGATIRPLLGTTTTFEYGPEGSTTGKPKLSGSVVVTSYSESTPVGDVAQWTADLQITDTVTEGTYA